MWPKGERCGGQLLWAGSCRNVLRWSQDDAEAVRWYRLAAAQGLSGAQQNLGFMFEKSRGFPQGTHAQDMAEAVRWYRLSAVQGSLGAQVNLATVFQTGRCAAQDYAEAARLWRLAAAQGHEVAQYNLGFMFQNGQGVAQDDGEAVRLYLAAAQGEILGDAGGQSALGYMYADRSRRCCRHSRSHPTVPSGRRPGKCIRHRSIGTTGRLMRMPRHVELSRHVQ